MDGFACSSWYFLRVASPDYQDGPFEPAAMAYWLPVDTYVGGAEHAVMHLLYARFWTKVMYDAGLVPFTEPFPSLRNQGVLHAADGARMSKSKGNVITPDEVVAEHGTDALRAFILFIGPFAGDVIWDNSGIRGITRFLERYWKLAQEVASDEKPDPTPNGDVHTWAALRRRQHQVIRQVTTDLEQFKLNTALAALMGYLNSLVEAAGAPARLRREGIETLTLLLAPIAPFVTEEVWQEALGHHGQSVHQAPWPDFDPELARPEQVTIAVQINGKLRDRIEAPADSDEATLTEMVLARDRVRQHLNGRPIARLVVVPNKLVSIAVD
jgi:leucyl-tRNA synthetase